MNPSNPQWMETRGLDLLLLHCRALDYDRPDASERLVQQLGPELTHTLLFALSGPGRDARPRAA